jgi:hypothetical protein
MNSPSKSTTKPRKATAAGGATKSRPKPAKKRQPKAIVKGAANQAKAMAAGGARKPKAIVKG